MKRIFAAPVYMCKPHAMFREEYSYREARPFQDKQQHSMETVS